MSSLLKNSLPPYVYNKLQALRKKGNIWKGDYPGWEQAIADSDGYDEASILNKIILSVKEVIDGKAVFERDSVAFYHKEVNHAVLAFLLHIAIENENELSVCDFGGSLGSTFLQHRIWFNKIKIAWGIVEQEHFINYALKNLTVEHLNFYNTAGEFAEKQETQTLLLSSVLSYLPNPFEVLDQLLSLNFKYIILDKTPVNPGPKSRLTVQLVPPEIYKASYPCWFISDEKLKNALHNYQLIDEFEVPMDCNLNLPHKGYFFKRIENRHD